MTTAGSVSLGNLEGLLAELKGEYADRRPQSEALYRRALGPLPGGNSRSQLDFDPFPFYVDHAEGPRLHDVDGITYIDLVNNYTSLIHGHPTPDVVERLKEAVARGTAFGAPTEFEVALAEEIVRRVPSIDQIRFANSGTEAGLYAIRLARLFTGRDDIIKAEGGYNGGFESVQVSVKHLGAANESVAEPGIHDGTRSQTHIIPFNDTDESVRIIEEVGPRSAAVIVEPMQGSAGGIAPIPGYLEALREATTKAGCLLIFDEVMTFRLGYGGLQQVLGVYPDLTSMGKIIGGGAPVGAFGGRADIMALTDPRRDGGLMHAGTFNANPFTMAAGLIAMQDLTEEKVDNINRRGDDLRSWINETTSDRGLPFVATGVGNLVQVHAGSTPPRSFRESKDRPKLPLSALFFLLLEEGVFTAPNRILMTISTAMGDAEMKQVKGAFDTAFTSVAGAGFRLAPSAV
jgi:glutamate-1-semialdehyde 2,1-aminomutase